MHVKKSKGLKMKKFTVLFIVLFLFPVILQAQTTVDAKDIIKQIKGISCHAGTDKALTNSCADAIGCAIEDAITKEVKKKK